MIEFPNERTAMALAKEYFMKRAISEKTIKACGLKVAGRTACLEAIGSTRRTNYSAGIVIPYTDKYCTIRWLGTGESQMGTRLNDDPKLLAPHGNPHTYIPPLPATSGKEFDGVVYVCESAMKAIALAQHGYYALAGNGVDGLYNSHGFAIGWPDALMTTQVKHAVILFDSDWQDNANVMAAIRRQATGISNHYPSVNIVHKALEHGPEGAWGIDDAIAEKGLEWLHEWLGGPEGDREVEVSPLQRHLDELNDEYVLCHKPMAIIKQGNNELYKRGDFTDMLEAPRCFKEKQGKGPMVEVSPAKEWLKWEVRNYVERLVYTPGQAKLCIEKLEYNLWKDDGVVATEGSVEPFLKVYKNAIPDDETRDLLIQSMAYMIQNRGVRLEKTFLLVGSQVGTGKSMFVHTMGKLFGRSNYSSIGVEDFTGDFNSAFTAKEVVLLDDLYKLGRPAMAKLKRYVTDETVMVNPKGVQQYEIDNHAVYFMTSNEYVSLAMDSNERRVLVCEFEPLVHYPTGTVWWEEYIAWLNGGGYGALRAWLEGIDLEGFDPSYMPPMTKAKIHMVNATLSPESLWVNDLKGEPDLMLNSCKRSAYTATELWFLFTGSGEPPTRAEGIGFGQALGQIFRQANNGKTCKVDGKSSRYWVVRGNGNDWASKNVIADVRKYPTINLS